MSRRIVNFGPGPAPMPAEILQEAAEEMLDFAGSGKSVMETSHRSPEYAAVHDEARALLLELLGLEQDYQALLFQGGATTQFALAPMNLRGPEQSADYVLTGSWSKKAFSEAKKLGQTHLAGSSEGDKFCRIPRQDELNLSQDAAYLHITTNNTIAGTQWQTLPQCEAPLIADMSSDILSRELDHSRFAMLYGGAQKNLGPAGVTIVVIRDEMLKRSPKDLPIMFSYAEQAAKESLSNTPPCFAVYMLGKTLKWIKANGIAKIAAENARKADCLYRTIDEYADFYRCPVQADSRSRMNVVFRLPSEELEAKLIAEAKSQDIIGIKGHRSVGGLRVSIYNAVPMEWVERMAVLLRDFVGRHGGSA